jgi:hypothetical protein
VAEIYHRTLGGRVTWIDAMTRAEIEEAVERAPYEWSLSLRGFAPWPADLVRGDPVVPASLADTVKPSASSLWERTE